MDVVILAIALCAVVESGLMLWRTRRPSLQARPSDGTEAAAPFTVTLVTHSGARARDCYFALDLHPDDACMFEEDGILRSARRGSDA